MTTTYEVRASNGMIFKVEAISPKKALLVVPRALGLDVNHGAVRALGTDNLPANGWIAAAHYLGENFYGG